MCRVSNMKQMKPLCTWRDNTKHDLVQSFNTQREWNHTFAHVCKWRYNTRQDNVHKIKTWKMLKPPFCVWQQTSTQWRNEAALLHMALRYKTRYCTLYEASKWKRMKPPFRARRYNTKPDVVQSFRNEIEWPPLCTEKWNRPFTHGATMRNMAFIVHSFKHETTWSRCLHMTLQYNTRCCTKFQKRNHLKPAFFTRRHTTTHETVQSFKIK